MMRSLWTAASGMKTQQMFVDNIANNLANVNTTGFKKESLEFKSLLYETLKESGVDENGVSTPVGLQIGHGVRTSASVKNFSQGNLETTNNPLDFAIDGSGFFSVLDSNGNELYTKEGAFKISVNDDASLSLTTTDGYGILNTAGEAITFDSAFQPDKLSVDDLGNMFYSTAEGAEDLGIQIGLKQFRNPAGLTALGGGYYQPTVASGEALLETDNEDLEKSSLTQNTLESSNVQVVEEMVRMIVAQRAYELNSKAITTSDDMLGIANNLKQ